jgi:acyl-coenzyme A synthetase/AMP-(fatty) acid ligase
VSYGSTEAGPSTSKELTAYTDDRSVGTCYKGIVVEIVDNDLSLLPNTQEGIIRIKSSNTIEEYLNAPDASLESFSDEWFYPGDRGYFDAEGSLYISGRIKDQLNINGAKINAVLIDEQIQATDGFMDGFCFTQEEEGIMVLSALVTAKSDISIDQTIKEFAKRIIDTHARSAMVPSRIYFVPRVPRNNGGKILRHQGSETVRGLKFINIVTGSNPDTKNENA